MAYTGYIAKLKHDNGIYTMLVNASSEKSAKEIIMQAENCPECAIISIRKTKNIIKINKS